MNKVKFFFIIGNFEFPQKNAPGIRVWGLGKIAQSFGWRVIFIGVTRSKTSDMDVSPISFAVPGAVH